MIHWDWVATILIISLTTTIISACVTGLTEPIKTERMKAEAALLEQKRLNKAARVA